MNLIKLIHFARLGDQRGGLIALESSHNIPFEIRRIYYIYDTGAGVSRGFHAHKALKQVAICLAGKCRMVLDDGYRRDEVWLDSPDKGLLIDSCIWREMYDFSPGCVLLVIASELYDEADYIRDYQLFKQSVQGAE